MKAQGIILSFFLMIIVSSCGSKTATVDKDKALADSLLRINEAAYNSGDANKVVDLFTNDCLLIDGTKAVWGKDSLMAVLKTVMPQIKKFTAWLGFYSVTPTMVQMEKYWIVDGVNNLKAAGISILVWVKQPDNQWKTVLEKTDSGFRMN